MLKQVGKTWTLIPCGVGLLSQSNRGWRTMEVVCTNQPIFSSVNHFVDGNRFIKL